MLRLQFLDDVIALVDFLCAELDFFLQLLDLLLLGVYCLLQHAILTVGVCDELLVIHHEHLLVFDLFFERLVLNLQLCYFLFLGEPARIEILIFNSQLLHFILQQL